MKHPLFSLVIATCDRDELLRKCLQSVQGQIYDDWEVHIVDDGQSPSTAALVKSMQESRFHYMENLQQGRSSARNQGIRDSRGQFILFLDDDDEIMEEHLSLFANAIARTDPKELKIYRTGFIRLENGAFIRTTNFDSSSGETPLHFVATNMCGVGSLCIPRIYLQEDMFPTEFSLWEDTHLFMRLLAKHRFEQLDAYTYIYRIHAQQGRLEGHSLAQQVDHNTAAMDDLFSNHAELLLELPRGMHKQLVLEKRLQYLIMALKMNDRTSARQIKRKVPFFIGSLRNFYFKIWILELKDLIKRLRGNHSP